VSHEIFASGHHFLGTTFGCHWGAVIALLLVPELSLGQMSKGREIAFFTSDHVELVGTFYATPRGKASPCVLLLHRIGGDSKEPGWEKLALTLQEKGYTVLSFDFRGHRQSTSVAPEFWLVPLNKLLKPLPNVPTNSIRIEQFTRSIHVATLVNDIRAAKRVLELKCHDGQCDSSNVIVVGAETGASLGLLWIDAEWQRWRMGKDSAGRPTKQGQEALDIAGAVWLSFSAQWPNRQKAPFENWLDTLTRERIPMGFLYGADDDRGKDRSTDAFEKLIGPPKEGVKNKSTIYGIKGASVKGSELLADNRLNASDLIVNFIEAAMATRRQTIRSSPDIDILPPLINPDAFGLR
jgi:pimeloyl-ACP methyl ester carboxylesterase